MQNETNWNATKLFKHRPAFATPGIYASDGPLLAVGAHRQNLIVQFATVLQP